MSYLVDVNGNPFMSDVVQQGTALAALNATNTVQLRGQATVTIQVTAIGTQTLTFEVSTDGTNFTVVSVWPVTNTGVPVTTTTATGHWQAVVAGFYQFRVRCSAYTSGSATVSVVASQGTNEQQVNVGVGIASTTAGQIGPLAQGAVTTANPAYTTAQTDPLSLTTAGGLRIALLGSAGVALDAATPGTIPANSVLMGGRAANANPTSATNGQIQAPLLDLSGRAIITPLNYRTLIKHQATTMGAGVVAETTIITAQGANVFADLVCLIITTVNVAAATITVRDVTAAGTPWIIDYPNAAAAPGTPLIIPFGDVPLQQGTANSAWTITLSANVTSVHITAQFVNRLA